MPTAFSRRPGLLESLVAPHGDRVLERLAAHEVLADLLDDQCHRHVAFAETGQRDFAADLARVRSYAFFDVGGRDLDGELDFVVAYGLDVGLHCLVSVSRLGEPPGPGARAAAVCDVRE